jgi:hypothetical protein
VEALERHTLVHGAVRDDLDDVAHLDDTQVLRERLATCVAKSALECITILGGVRGEGRTMDW